MAAQASADFEVYGYDMATTDSVSAALKRALMQVKVCPVNISRSDYLPEYQVDLISEVGDAWIEFVSCRYGGANRINGGSGFEIP